MLEEKTIKIYDQEADKYTLKRYAGPIDNYVKYLFLTRRKIFLGLMSKIRWPKAEPMLLEIGCADGVIMRSVKEKFPNLFKRYVGIDISPKMIEAAQQQNPGMEFYLRDQLPAGQFDLIIEMGVGTYFVSELEYVKKLLAPDGYFIYALAGKESLHIKFKHRDADFLGGYRDYRTYEAEIAKHFQIVKSVPYALFVPKLWTNSRLGAKIQPLVDRLARKFLPADWFHEKIYLLKNK